MTIEAIAVSLGAFLSALSGGWLALRAVRYVGAIIAVGAGIRIGAAFVDLVPEAIDHLQSLDAAMLWTTIGFVSFYVVDKLTSLHVGHETSAELDHEEADHQHIGVVGAIGMGIHSLLDGVALAAGLAAGGAIGAIIAFVVIVHRFSDGIGVVSFLLTSRMSPGRAMRWVAVVAAAVLLGHRLLGIGSVLTARTSSPSTRADAGGSMVMSTIPLIPPFTSHHPRPPCTPMPPTKPVWGLTPVIELRGTSALNIHPIRTRRVSPSTVTPEKRGPAPRTDSSGRDTP